MAWIPVNETITATPNQKYLLDSSAAEFSIVLPSLSAIGTSVILADGADVSVNKVSVIADAQFPFEGGATFFLMEVTKSQFEFVFDGFNWIVYNLSRQGVKVSDLPEQPVSQISSDDLIPFVNADGSSYESTAIPYINLKQQITDGVFTTAEQVVDSLNDSPAIARLNVSLFDGQNSTYYLDYTNLTNTPNIVSIVNQQIGSFGFITDLDSFTTDDLVQGQNNLYLDQTNFNTFFEPAFGEAYKVVSGDFPEESVRDSSGSITGSPLTTSSATTVINITNAADVERFFQGKKIRIYGASASPLVSIPTPSNPAATKRGFVGEFAGASSVRYKVIQFNLNTGEYSPTSNETGVLTGINFDKFNTDNNVLVTFSRASTEYGILVYRSVGSASFVLIDVLGPLQLGGETVNITYTDYGKFNHVTWSRKNKDAGNVYDGNTGLMHFPAFVTATNISGRGWVETTVSSIDTVARRISVSESLYFNNNIIISEDDTEQIQNAVNQRTSLGVNSLTLNNRRYIVSRLDIPNDFVFLGRGQSTVLRKLAWDSGTTNKVISALNSTSENIVLSNFSIDGNMQNQWLKSETSDRYVNYAIDLKDNGIGNTVDRVRMSNVIAGGLSSSKPTKLMVDRSRFENSGMSDLIEYAPLLADDGEELVITNNIFKNFTAAIDISLSDNGVFTSNVVENVGSGVFTYGSKFLISAPNIIRGPAGEFIPGPDVLNSVYDSVNIKLEPGTVFTSDVYGYQENGLDFDLTSNEAELSYRLDKIRLVANAEELYGQVLLGTPAENNPIQPVSDVLLDATRGKFKFTISEADVDTILTDYSVSALRETEPNHVGLVYSAKLTEYVPAGDIIGQTIPSANQYRVTVTDFKHLAVGSRVKMINHGGTPNLDSKTIIGTVTEINTPNTVPPEANVTITYPQNVTVAGSGGQITVENTFILAKGRVF